MTPATTLPGLLVEQAARRPRAAALRHKRLGIWRVVTWSEYAAAVREIALALDAAGIGAGDSVAVLAANEPAWLYVDLAAQATGARSVGVYPSLPAEEVAAAIGASGARIAFCGDQEQVDKLLALRPELPALEAIVVFDTKGLHIPEYAEAPLEGLETLRAPGRECDEARFDELLAARSGDDVALVAFTSGTTRAARGALLCQRGEVALARLVCERLKLGPSDRAFSLLPLGHATARVVDGYAALVAGSSVNFAESSETVLDDLVELAPTVVVATPRLLERIRGDVELRIARASRLKRAAYERSMRLMASPGPRRSIGRLLVGRFIVGKAGLGSLRYGGIAGSFVAPELLAWFWALGMPMREQYGQVETGGIVSTQLAEGDAGTAGRPLADAIEVRLDDADELLVRTPGALAGYLGDEQPALEDGWYRTGDVVRFDGGRIVPVARRNQIVATQAGDELSPAEVESSLKLSPYIASAVVVAADRPFVSALLELHHEAVVEWARRRGIGVTTYGQLAGDDQVVGLVAAAVEEANSRLPEGRRVRAFRILPRPLADELTPTGKIKRAVVEERFAPLLAEIYTGDRAVAESPAA